MKRLLFFALFAVIFADTLSAQIVPGLQYSDLKNIYYAREYKHMPGDPYSPALSAVGSFFIPGLGQFCCGEKGRGLWMFAAGAAIDAAMIFSATQFIYYLDVNGALFTDYDEAAKWAGATFGFTLGALAYGVFSSIDAVNVAKVRNMYYRDLNKLQAIELNMYPSLNFARTQKGATPAAGVTLSMRF
ncbi:MAG: hypothetical protein J5801_01090 [Bacteroidales bacterium]|nr:hypothetical protein [Bacteroidales bacterium]